MCIYVVWCKWCWLVGDFRLHYSRRFGSIDKAAKYANKISKDSRKFIWSYIVNGKEVESL